MFAHLTVLHFSLFYSTFYFLFLFLPIYMLLYGVTFIYIFYSLHCPLSGPDLTYILLWIIPCIIYYVTNKETLNLFSEPALPLADSPSSAPFSTKLNRCYIKLSLVNILENVFVFIEILFKILLFFFTKFY